MCLDWTEHNDAGIFPIKKLSLRLGVFWGVAFWIYIHHIEVKKSQHRNPVTSSCTITAPPSWSKVFKSLFFYHLFQVRLESPQTLNCDFLFIYFFCKTIKKNIHFLRNLSTIEEHTETDIWVYSHRQSLKTDQSFSLLTQLLNALETKLKTLLNGNIQRIKRSVPWDGLVLFEAFRTCLMPPPTSPQPQASSPGTRGQDRPLLAVGRRPAGGVRHRPGGVRRRVCLPGHQNNALKAVWKHSDTEWRRQ